MTKQRSLGAAVSPLSWAFVAVACMVALAGCSGVKKCKQGEAGCIGGPCESGSSCDFDLTCVSGANLCGKPAGDKIDFGTCMQGEPGCYGGGCDNGKCDEGFTCVNNTCMPESVNPGDGDGDGGEPDAGGPTCTDMCMESDPDAVCTTDTKECVNFCAVPEDGILPGSLADDRDPPIFCAKQKDSDPDLTFADVCKRRCELQCRLQDWFCGDAGKCAPGYCDGPDIQVQCLADCTEGDDEKKLACLQDSCQTTRATGCLDTKCPGDKPPQCAGVSCTNDASKCTALMDGWCDDGDTFGTKPVPGEPVNTDSNLCKWGTDCADCGPRYGEDKSTNIPQGELCNYNSACAGHIRTGQGATQTVDLTRNEAWCLELTAVQAGVWRCMPDASGKTANGSPETCPDGYMKRTLQDANMQDIVINGITVQVCIPNCGIPQP